MTRAEVVVGGAAAAGAGAGADAGAAAGSVDAAGALWKVNAGVEAAAGAAVVVVAAAAASVPAAGADPKENPPVEEEEVELSASERKRYNRIVNDLKGIGVPDDAIKIIAKVECKNKDYKSISINF